MACAMGPALSRFAGEGLGVPSLPLSRLLREREGPGPKGREGEGPRGPYFQIGVPLPGRP